VSDDDDAAQELLRLLKDSLGEARFEQAAKALEREAQRREVQPDRAEVRAWLAMNKREHPLAVNHFWQRADAERFVEDLYAAGAPCVMVENIAYHDEAEWGGPTSDALSVDLPSDADARAQVFALCNAHCMADSSMGALFVDEGQPALYLWWN
jgi:hypothetical protein